MLLIIPEIENISGFLTYGLKDLMNFQTPNTYIFKFSTYVLLLNGGLSSHEINVHKQSSTSATADIVSVLTIACLLDVLPTFPLPFAVLDG